MKKYNIHKRVCDSCGNYYEGYGLLFCSLKCFGASGMSGVKKGYKQTDEHKNKRLLSRKESGYWRNPRETKKKMRKNHWSKTGKIDSPLKGKTKANGLFPKNVGFQKGYLVTKKQIASSIKKCKERGHFKRTSERMKQNNPMRESEIVRKTIKTKTNKGVFENFRKRMKKWWGSESQKRK